WRGTPVRKQSGGPSEEFLQLDAAMPEQRLYEAREIAGEPQFRRPRTAFRQCEDVLHDDFLGILVETDNFADVSHPPHAVSLPLDLHDEVDRCRDLLPYRRHRHRAA